MLVALRSPVRLDRAASARHGDFSFLHRRFTPHTVFMEIGGADSKLALRAAGYVERVYAVDVSGQFLQDVLMPCNLRLVLCDGVRIPMPEGAVDVAWSGAFMDQLHPDDALEHLKSVRRALVAGGEYLCMTRKSVKEASQRLVDAGFRLVHFYAAGMRLPGAIASLLPPHLLRIGAVK